MVHRRDTSRKRRSTSFIVTSREGRGTPLPGNRDAKEIARVGRETADNARRIAYSWGPARTPDTVENDGDVVDPHNKRSFSLEAGTRHGFDIEAGALALCVYRDPDAEQHPHTAPCKASIAMFKEALSAARGSDDE